VGAEAIIEVGIGFEVIGWEFGGGKGYGTGISVGSGAGGDCCEKEEGGSIRDGSPNFHDVDLRVYSRTVRYGSERTELFAPEVVAETVVPFPFERWPVVEFL
jgi:hypothetical protein